MRYTNRFSTIARIIGALTAAALLALAAAPSAMAQVTPTPFGEITKTPTNNNTKVNGVFGVTFLFKNDTDNDGVFTDEDGLVVTGFTHSDISVTDTLDNTAGVVQSITRNSSTNVYTVNVRANSDASGSITVTLAASSVQYTDTAPDPDVNYTNGSAESVIVVVDQAKPTVTLTVEKLGGDDDTDQLVNGKFQVRFTFNEAVSGFALTDISAPNTAKSNFTTVTAGTVYTADFMPNASFNGTVTVRLNSGSVNDAVGNLNEAEDVEVKVDQTKPTVTIAAPSQWGDEAFTATFTFSEPVNGFAADDIDVVGKAADDTPITTGYTISEFSGSDGDSVYTADITPTNTTVSLTIDIAADSAHDLAGIASDTGNGNAAATTKSVTIDAARPTASTTITLSNGKVDLSDANTTTFPVTITFSESVIAFQQGASPADVQVSNGTVTFTGNLPGQTFMATVTPTANYEGPITITIPANAAQSNADNTKGNPKYTRTVNVSQGAPTVTVAASKPKTKGPFGVTITFSEPVTGFEKGDITLDETYAANTPSGNAEISNFSGSGTTYTATITPPERAADGDTIELSVAAEKAMDRVGNNNTASPDTGDNANPTVTIDQTAPTVDISSDGSANGKFTATFTFNEDMKSGTFTQGDISVVNGSAGPVNALTGSATTFTSEITPSSNFNGTLTIGVSANRATDVAGNANKAYDRVADDTTPPIDDTTLGIQLWEVAIDQKAPTVTVSAPSKANAAYTATFTFSEAVTGLTTDDIEVSATNTGVADDEDSPDDESKLADATVTSVSGGGTAWTAIITPRLADTTDGDDVDTPNVDESKPFNGNMTVNVKADGAIDATGNGNTASSKATVNIDTVKPTLTIKAYKTGTSTALNMTSGDTPLPIINGPFDVKITFNESVTGFDSSDITITNGSVATPADDFSGSGTTYTAKITPETDYQGAITITVAADTADDAHGNGNVVYDSNLATTDQNEVYTVTIDTTDPVPVITLINPDSLTQFGHAQDLQLTVSFKDGTADPEEVKGLTASDFTFKYVDVERVVNDNATPADTTDDTTTDTDGTETNGGASVVSVVASASETDHTFTLTINPAAFSRTVTKRDGTTPTGSKETVTAKYQRKLRIYFNAEKVKDLAGNDNSEYDRDTTETGIQGREIDVVPGIPALAITTSLPKNKAFNGNDLSDGSAFTVTFVFTGVTSVGVFGSEDVELKVGDNTATSSQATLTEFSGSGLRYTAKVTPTPDDETTTGTDESYTGPLTINVAANINGIGNYRSTRAVYIDQNTPEYTLIAGIWKEEDGERSETKTDVAGTTTAAVDGSPFYVDATFDEEVEGLTASDFEIYETGDAKKVSVGTASEITAGDATTTSHTWSAKITPNSNFYGDMSVSIKEGAVKDRANRTSTIHATNETTLIWNPG